MSNIKKIVGLDVGTNSVGWAIIERNFDNEFGAILGLGARILPMDQAEISDFNQGNLQSAAANRTHHRGVRRLRDRQLKRRNRIVKVLKNIGFISNDWEPNSKYSLAFKKDKFTGKTLFKFQDAYNEMSNLFRKKHPHLRSVSHDWVIYYLRSKALSQKISGEELAWIILQFNVKRGYFQLRDDEALMTEDSKYFINSIVDEIVDLEDDVRGRKSLMITLRNGVSGLYADKEIPAWVGKSMDFIVTEKMVKGKMKVTLTNPDENDWTLRKKKTEQIIDNSNKTVGQYIFDKLLNDPFTKIRGREVHTIDRKFYKQELEKIIGKQAEFHPEFTDRKLYKSSVQILYKRNLSHKTNLYKFDLKHLIIKDILYYQRPLKSKKHLISNCKFEVYKYKNKNGEIKEKPVKCISKSHPLFQEFRIWEYVHNIKVFKKEERDTNNVLRNDVDKTDEILTNEMKVKLFDAFDLKKELSQSQILKAVGCDTKNFKINYEDGVKLKGNELKQAIHKCLLDNSPKEETDKLLNDHEKLENIWHAVYSLGDSKDTLEAGLSNPKIGLTENQIQSLSKMPSFTKEYGSFSRKAISKLLPIMRCGKYWDWNNINDHTKSRIEQFITAEDNIEINDRSRDNLAGLTSEGSYQGLNLAMASYTVYGRHSESLSNSIYKSYEDVDINSLIPNHSLRNPTAEKIIRETLLVVRDLWKKYGKIDLINMEMARELKLPNDKRKEYTNRRNENYRKNQRAKAMLLELSSDNSDINPHSKGHLETFKIFEEGAVINEKLVEKDIAAIRKKGDPSRSELIKYKLWLEQKYKSPYTGQIIQLSKLFTPAYEIEHIIPKALFYDDSFNNKIICETAANRYKENRTAYELICNDGGKEVAPGIILLTKDQYEQQVKEMFISINYKKYKNLMNYDPPKGFSKRQLNNTRFINRKLLELLDPFVRDLGDKEARSRNLLPIVGGITSELKNDWGLHNVWKRLIAPRFQRMNEITESNDFINIVDNRIDLSGYENELKRLDHRHHALDALVIACTKSDHINYKNSLKSENRRYDLEKKLFNPRDHNRRKSYKQPWPSLIKDAELALNKILISFKNRVRIISKTNNYYQKYIELPDGSWRKSYVKQINSPDHFAIRKPIHQETIYGKVILKEYKSLTLNNALETPDLIANKSIRKPVLKIYNELEKDVKKLKKYFKKNPLEINDQLIEKVEMVSKSAFATSQLLINDKVTEGQLTKIIDQELRNALLNHLSNHNGNSADACSTNGLIAFNQNRHKPITMVTVKQDLGIAFQLSEFAPKHKKYVKGAKGTNLYFLIYRNNISGEHLITSDSTITFKDLIEIEKIKEDKGEQKEGHHFFTLSPDDLVYVFKEGEEKVLPENLDISRIYKCVSFSKHQCFFIPQYVSVPIVNKKEFSANNKTEKSIDGIMIKKNCLKLKIDRLGEIIGTE